MEALCNVLVSLLHAAYQDLLDGQAVPAAMGAPFLETRKGQPRDTNGLPPSVLTVNWSTGHSDKPSGTFMYIIMQLNGF